ncbi:MAG: hypothetical protein ACREIF_04385 [Chthoniobacterales bacterium]
MVKLLTVSQRARYNDNKRFIRKWAVDDFRESVRRLIEIHDEKQYIDDHATFEDCCAIEFGWKRATGYRLMESEKNRQSLEDLDLSQIETKSLPASQVKVLVEVEPEKREKVVRLAAAAGKVTAKTLTAAAAKVSAPAEEIRDDTGYLIPPKAMPFWEQKGEMEATLRLISVARSAIRNLPNEDPMLVEVNVQSVICDLGNAYREFKTAVPYAVCPVCQGQAPETCTFCKGRGLVSRFRFETMAPQELKSIRAKSCKQ